ncbi:hypothetical protein BDQ12DRAFT_682789 [Crucibulum laeve]|uniref:Uncharacterized protein n=1 Tax=Crucibulum laeve TaxID=68775 RepID=A0A5C3M3M0_9AGAR|nr:hypothetical protein BDQ12DRAFT_682789 [Crucibulum laeve]
MPSSTSHTASDEYPSMLWITIPPVLLLSAYFIRKWYLAYRLKNYGIGKGAPGFQTNVRRIRVTPEIAARLRRGEDVSPEEIAAASAKADEEERRENSGVIETPLERKETPSVSQTPPEPANEWLPESITGPKKRGKGKKR